ncbi:hypothetical protein FOCC_FOCC011752 [Frankliniella occidentalis]|nr:hypothetical protein FOCC_FOCC011752 [Frankliniella occidentalis]
MILCIFSPRVYQFMNYGRFPPSFVEPVYHPDKFNKLNSEEVKELMHKNVKPPTTSQSASVFHDPHLEKLVNFVMKSGRKAKAREIIKEAFEKIKRAQVRKYHLANDSAKLKIPTNPLEIFHQALQNCKPVLTVTPVKRGGVVYKVPVALDDTKATRMAYKWLVETSREHEPRRNHTGVFFSDRLAKELMDASDNTGKTIKKKVELHKLCEANKAYAHYRWGK